MTGRRLAELRSWFTGAAPILTTGESNAGPPSTQMHPPFSMRLPRVPVITEHFSHWTETRLAAASLLWGDGCILPGGTAELRRLTAPLGLSPATTLILLGAGPGGAVRGLAGALGVWVSGYEADPALLAAAQDRLPKLNQMERRATIESWDPRLPGFRTSYYHNGVALEPFRTGEPDLVLTSLAAALKPQAQLVLVDLVADTPLDAADPLVAAWARAEHRPARVPTEQFITEVMGKRGFDVRVVEDMSRHQEKLALTGWGELLTRMVLQKPPPRLAAALVTEAELWLLRFRMMRAGRLRLLRWHAIR
jgi:hypothetical protein